MRCWAWLAPALLAVVAGCHDAGVDYGTAVRAPAGRNALAAVDTRHEAGRKIYNFRCYFCHGYSGDGRTLASTYLTPAPRNFTATRPDQLPREPMLAAVRDGKPGTAMKSFAGILSAGDMHLVVDFVRREFMERQAGNTRYHTAENGWPHHERYRDAYPFATGAIALDTPWERLDASQQRGKRLYLASCITCHDRGRVTEDALVWEGRPLSYPRNQFQPGTAPDAVTSASPYALHDIKPSLAGLDRVEQLGETLFQGNCAFCHGADGTGRNWIGSFMEPHPRNLADPAFMSTMTRDRLRQVIRDGLPETSMPAWKSVLEPHEIDAVIAYISLAFHPVH